MFFFQWPIHSYGMIIGVIYFFIFVIFFFIVKIFISMPVYGVLNPYFPVPNNHLIFLKKSLQIWLLIYFSFTIPIMGQILFASGIGPVLFEYTKPYRYITPMLSPRTAPDSCLLSMVLTQGYGRFTSDKLQNMEQLAGKGIGQIGGCFQQPLTAHAQDQLLNLLWGQVTLIQKTQIWAIPKV